MLNTVHHDSVATGSKVPRDGLQWELSWHEIRPNEWCISRHIRDTNAASQISRVYAKSLNKSPAFRTAFISALPSPFFATLKFFPSKLSYFRLNHILQLHVHNFLADSFINRRMDTNPGLRQARHVPATAVVQLDRRSRLQKPFGGFAASAKRKTMRLMLLLVGALVPLAAKDTVMV